MEAYLFLKLIKVHPRTGHEVSEGSRDIALLFVNHVARWGWVFNATLGRFIPGNDPVPIV